MEFSTRKGLTDFLRAARFSYTLRTVAEMDIARHVANGCTLPELAKKLGASEVSGVARIVRSCAAVGLFALDGENITPTEASRFLRSDHPDSLVPVILFTTDPDIREAYGALGHSILTGESSFAKQHGKDSFAYFAENPLGKVFSAAMESVSHVQDQQCASVLAKQSGSIVMDIGGGKGGLLSQLVQQTGHTGILFDLPSVIDQVTAPAQAIQYVKGDFFVDDLPAADTVIMRKILHDWGDDDCRKILQSAKKALNAGGKIAIIEVIRGTGDEAQEFAKSLMDIEMLVMTGKGGERSLADFEKLLGSVGLQVVKTEAIDSLYSVLWAKA